jgi:hypothetical protein
MMSYLLLATQLLVEQHDDGAGDCWAPPPARDSSAVTHLLKGGSVKLAV